MSMSPARQTAGRSLYIQLRQQILDNTLESGKRMLETELASETGLSRTPVREALTLLRAEGLLSEGPTGMLQVARLDREEDVREIYDLRIPLESYAYGCAASRRTAEELEQILEHSARVRELKTSDSSFVLEAHRRLETVILRATHNPRLERQCQMVSDYSFMRAVLLRYPKVNVDEALASQFAAVDAIATGDVHTAESTRRAALEAAREIAVELVRQSNQQPAPIYTTEETQ